MSLQRRSDFVFDFDPNACCDFASPGLGIIVTVFSALLVLLTGVVLVRNRTPKDIYWVLVVVGLVCGALGIGLGALDLINGPSQSPFSIAAVYPVILAFFLACAWTIGFDILRLAARHEQSRVKLLGKGLPVIPFLWNLVIPLLYAAQYGSQGAFPHDAGTSRFMVYGYWIHVGMLLSIWLGHRKQLGLPFALYGICMILSTVGQTVMYSLPTFKSGFFFFSPSEPQTMYDLRTFYIIRCVLVEVVPIIGVAVAVLCAGTRSSRWFYGSTTTKSSTTLNRTNPI